MSHSSQERRWREFAQSLPKTSRVSREGRKKQIEDKGKRAVLKGRSSQPVNRNTRVVNHVLSWDVTEVENLAADIRFQHDLSRFTYVSSRVLVHDLRRHLNAF